MKKFLRTIAVASTAVIGFASVCLFTACDTNYPEVTITYEFRGETYAVDYILTRKGAPQTVRHFIELADAGYYDGTVIHDYRSNGIFLYGGAYVLGENNELVEKDYWSELRRLEQEKNITFTQSVYAAGSAMSGYFAGLTASGASYVAGGETYTADSELVPLYTLYGEFSNNGVEKNGKSYYHNAQGTLAMSYTDNGSGADFTVTTVRSDGGDNAADNSPTSPKSYKLNCATSIFYTFTSSDSRTSLDDSYAAFGRTKDFSQLQALLADVTEYSNSLELADGDEDGVAFTVLTTIQNVNQYDPIDSVRNAKIPADYSVPVEPIVIRSVKVNKY